MSAAGTTRRFILAEFTAAIGGAADLVELRPIHPFDPSRTSGDVRSLTAFAGIAARASAGRGKSRRAKRPPPGVGVSLHRARPRTGIQAARRCARPAAADG